MQQTALLIIDVQEGLILDHPTQEKLFLKHIKEILSLSRNHEFEIIFIRHQDDDDLIPNTPRWNIYHDILPTHDEIIIDKRKNSAFNETNLQAYLNEKHIQNLIMVGMQTEHCVDATCKSAFEKGYQVYIPRGCVTTFDNKYLSGEKCNEYYYDNIWNKRYANVGSIEEIINKISYTK